MKIREVRYLHPMLEFISTANMRTIWGTVSMKNVTQLLLCAQYNREGGDTQQY